MDWTHITVADDGTHHLDDGRPLYQARFDAVLKFHAPGLAPVRAGDEAWHIDLGGRSAYARRFVAAFGYYESLAAVVSLDGWHHITTDGQDLYVDRFDWCGNFQGGRCTVRDDAGRYHHIDRQGREIYAARWRYAGDYRDGVAVVQRTDGLSSHIDRQGRPTHGRWFSDLDVFHKGFARARDEDGWTHVDHAGRAVYRRRFASVEPFYNGQARVERFDGGIEVIDETGHCITELRPARRSEFHALSADIVGSWRTDTLAAAVELGVFEALPASPDELAGRCALPGDSARRLLRALAELGVVERTDDLRWRANVRGAHLERRHPHSLADAAIEAAGPLRARWSRLVTALRDVNFKPGDIFREVAATPHRRDAHHRMLRSYAEHDYAPMVARLPVPPRGVVLDAGGGTGALARLIVRHWPEVQVSVLDLPQVVAELAPDPRVQAIAGDLFAPWPASADLVILARVLHDWDDDDAATILTHARAALRPGGRIAVLDLVLDEHRPGGGLCDLHLRVVTGGRERTLAEFRGLCARSGLSLRTYERAGELLHVLTIERSAP